MPYIELKTNVPVTEDEETALKETFGQAITVLPGKSEQWLMVQVEDCCRLHLAGSNAPAALLAVSAYGTIAQDGAEQLTAQLTKAVTRALPVPANRVYVRYAETDLWGWNGANL